MNKTGHRIIARNEKGQSPAIAGHRIKMKIPNSITPNLGIMSAVLNCNFQLIHKLDAEDGIEPPAPEDKSGMLAITPLRQITPHDNRKAFRDQHQVQKERTQAQSASNPQRRT